MGKAAEDLSTDWVGPSTCSLYEEWDAAWVEKFEARVEHGGADGYEPRNKKYPVCVDKVTISSITLHIL